MDKGIAPDREVLQTNSAKEKENSDHNVITNREEGKGKPRRLFPKTGYPLGYPEPALSRRLKRERERERERGGAYVESF